MHYYNRNIGDYHKKAGRLSILQHGVYNLLMDACYDRETFPTRDEAIDWVWASSQLEIDAVDLVLRKFFIEDENGRFVQNRIEEEVAKYQEFCRKQSEKGKKGGRGKKSQPFNNKTQNKPVGFSEKATALENGENESQKKPKPLTTNQEPLTTNQISSGDSSNTVTTVEESNNSDPPTKKSTRLPDDFQMPTEWIQWACINGGFSKEKAEYNSQLFTLHYQSLPEDDAYRFDWYKVWMKWVLKDYQHAASKSISSNTKLSAAERCSQSTREWLREQRSH